MGKIVITSTPDSIKMLMGDHTNEYDEKEITRSRRDIQHVSLKPNNKYVKLLFKDGTSFKLSFDGLVGKKVDTVDAVVPGSNQDLCDKLAPLIK